IVAFYPEPGVNALHFIVFNKELEILLKQRFDFPLPDGDYNLQDVLIDNDGNIYIALYDNTKLKRSDELISRTRLFAIYRNESHYEIQPIHIELNRFVFGNIRFETDNVNGQLLVCGLYSDENRKIAKGYFYKTFDYKNR